MNLLVRVFSDFQFALEMIVEQQLTPAMRTHYKTRLQSRLDALSATISAEAAARLPELHANVAAEVHDRGEESNADAEAEVSSAILDSHSAELARIRHALRRIDDGTYGICEDCAAPITQARLNANPCARRCIECQSDFERRVD